ncbi:hypothetical protein [Pontibacter sp. H249]|uniref:hypothetical protein n=1 Tax=Pontibacter sp. H249 TaxID=3133420 RepID=UPI0030BE1386
MKTIELNQFNTTFRVEGSSQTRSLEIKKVDLYSSDSQGLKLNVIDEKDITIYSQPLNQSGITVVGKRFVFYDHLSVNVEAEQADTTFAVTLHIVLN